MMIDEFKDFQGENARPITMEEYKLVEFVYTYHPLNLDKQACANLFNEFGLVLFLDMLPRAKKAAELETQIRIARQQLHDLNIYYDELASCKTEEWNLEI